MNGDEVTRVKVWLVGQTDKAFRVFTLPHTDPLKRMIFLPKSQVAVVTRTHDAPFDEMIVDVPDWLCDKCEL